MSQQHFWVECYLPNGRRIYASSSKSTTSEGRVLAKLIGQKIANGSVKLAESTGSVMDQPEATRLPVQLVVRAWDGLTADERIGGNDDPWAASADTSDVA